jgi:hypothetical protein
MATITLKINEKSKEGKALMDLIKLFSVKKTAVEIIRNFNEETIKAIEDVEQGKTIKVKNSKELFKNLGI